jgi:alpha-amylase
MAILGIVGFLSSCRKLNDGANKTRPLGPAPELRVAGSGGLDLGRKLSDESIDWRKEVIYQVMIDRFVDGDASNNEPSSDEASYEAYSVYTEGQSETAVLKKYQGGDLAGLKEKLPYIKDLGFTALWLSPIYENSDAPDYSYHSYHGYHPVDFYGVERRFGDLALLKETVTEAHALGLKVILDVVNNHTGKKHPFVNDLNLWREGGYHNWFNTHAHESNATSIFNWGSQEEIRNKELAGLPDFDLSNPYVVDYLVDVSKYWIQELGVDGLRLDAVRHGDEGFWKQFNQRIKAYAGENFLLIGEIFSEDPLIYRPYRDASFDSFFDFPTQSALVKIFGQDAPLTELTKSLQKSQELFAEGKLAGLFLDNHDLSRFSYMVKDQTQIRSRTKLALAYLFAAGGIPQVYYGTEVLLEGGPKTDPLTNEGSDYLNRRMMSFDGVARESEWDGMISFLKNLNKARKDYDALAVGQMVELYKDAQTYIFAKVTDSNFVLVSLNASSEERYLEIPLRFEMLQKTLTEAETMDSEGLLSYSALRLEPGVLKITLKASSADVHGLLHEQDAVLPEGYDFTTTESIFTAPGAVDVVFTFQTERSDIGSLALAGSFNGWSKTTNMFTQVAPGSWSVTVQLKPNVYEYKLVINDNEWIQDPLAAEQKSDGFGGGNSVIRVTAD